jgi:hypothetical protein
MAFQVRGRAEIRRRAETPETGREEKRAARCPLPAAGCRLPARVDKSATYRIRVLAGSG